MRYRKLTPSGDYSFGSGQLDFYRDTPEAVGQAASTRYQLWRGEWFLDLSEGTPFMQGIIGKYSKSDADRTTQDRIRGTQGFVDFESFESEIDPETRVYSFETTINTIYGRTALQVANERNV